MRNTRSTRKLLAVALIHIVGLGSCSSDSPSTTPAQSCCEKLDLSIFEASRTSKLFEGDRFDLKQLVQELARRQPSVGDAAGGTNEIVMAPMVPFVFAKAKQLLAKDHWDKTESKEIRLALDLLVRMCPDIKLTPDVTEPTVVRDEFEKACRWFERQTEDDSRLAAFIFTSDDGPFFGGKADPASLAEMKPLEKIEIPGAQALLILYEDAGAEEPIIVAVQRHGEESPVSARRLTGKPKGTVRTAKLVKERPPLPVGRYGYKCSLTSDWDFGKEYTHLYVSPDLKIRFYFISW